MKKKWKIFWGTCVISGLIGVVFLVTAFAMGVTFEKMEHLLPGGISIGSSEEIQVTDSGNSYEGITALDIELKAGEVEIYTHDDECVEISTEGISDKLKLSYYREGNTLVVDSADDLLDIGRNDFGKITIYLPYEMNLSYAEVSVGAGALYVESINTDDLSVEVGAGTVDIYSFTAQRAHFSCGAGDMNLRGLTEEAIDIDCGMGNVNYEAPDSEASYNYIINCGVGEIQCGLSSYSGIGSERRIDNYASKKMRIDCGIGKVTVRFEE